MINFFKKYWLIILILVLASFLRFYKLGTYPALNADEASIGYDAYSLLKTGMDQHGNPWPVHFQSFNDYKPGLYEYLVIPFVKFFGLNAWSVRIPNAFLGVLSVLIIYLLVEELFSSWERGKTVALTSALFLAISPWHLQFSRGGWEVNTSTFFMMLGVLMFLRAIKKPSIINFFYSLLPFALSLYAYHAARVVAPILGVGLVLIYKKELFNKQNAKILVISSLILVALLIPLARDMVKGDVLSRAAGVGLFADPGPINRIDEQRGEHGSPNSIVAKVIHNKVVNFSLAFLENWGAHYHGLFLFISGDDVQRDKVPETGEMYLFDIVFVLAGMAYIFKDFSENKKSYSLLLLWLFAAPIPAALTFQAPSALRAQNMVIPLIIISSIGLVYILGLLETVRKQLRVVGWGLIIIFVVWNFTRYEHMYFVHLAKEYPFSSQYGVSELVSYVEKNQDKYKNIVVTDKYDQPYILFLFYMKYPPTEFQFHHTLTSRDNFGFSTVREFGKYEFITFSDLPTVEKDYPGSLIIGTPNEIPKAANIVKRIYGQNGYEYFDIVSN